MNIAAFAVVHSQETETGNDRISGLAGLGRRNPLLAWVITIAMLALAGIPGTVGFIGKFQLIHALVDGGYAWLAIVLVVGAMISLGYYLKVVAAVWMSPAPSSASGSGSGLAPAPGPGSAACANRGRLARGRQAPLSRGAAGWRAVRGRLHRVRRDPRAAVRPRCSRRQRAARPVLSWPLAAGRWPPQPPVRGQLRPRRSRAVPDEAPVRPRGRLAAARRVARPRSGPHPATGRR